MVWTRGRHAWRHVDVTVRRVALPKYPCGSGGFKRLRNSTYNCAKSCWLATVTRLCLACTPPYVASNSLEPSIGSRRHHVLIWDLIGPLLKSLNLFSVWRQKRFT